jgi:hypothetical protein
MLLSFAADFGIGQQDIKKLKAVGILTICGVMQVPRKVLCDVRGLSEAKVPSPPNLARI